MIHHKHVIIGNSVYRRVEAVRAPKPQQMDPNALMQLAEKLGFKMGDRLSPIEILGRLETVLKETQNMFVGHMKKMEQYQKAFRQELVAKPARASEMLQEYYGGDNALRNLSNYENTGMMEDWAEFPAKVGMSYVDMSNELPGVMPRIGAIFDDAEKSIETFRDLLDLVAEVDVNAALKMEKMATKMEDALKESFQGGAPVNRI